MRHARFVMIIVVLCASGCSSESEPQAERFEPVVSKSTESPAPEQPSDFVVKGVAFSVTPSQIRRCDMPSGKARAIVRWDAAGVGAKFVRIHVTNGSAPPTLFVEGTTSGEKATGEWLVDGTVLTLEDAANKRQLAKVKISAVDC